MQCDQFSKERRLALRRLLAAGTLGLAPLPALIKTALAMGRYGYAQEMREVNGDVRLNSLPARVGTPVNHGDVVATGTPGRAIFILGKAVFLVRENTRIELPAKPEDTLKEKTGEVIRLARGKVLAVLGKSRLRFITPTAVIGIRGTGLYLETDSEKTYVCLCYGKATLRSAITGAVLEDIKTHYHDSPRYIYKSPTTKGQLISRAPVINHTDAELILLESLVGRRPPFAGSGGNY